MLVTVFSFKNVVTPLKAPLYLTEFREASDVSRMYCLFLTAFTTDLTTSFKLTKLINCLLGGENWVANRAAK